MREWLAEDERVELLDGVIMPTSPTSPRHTHTPDPDQAGLAPSW